MFVIKTADMKALNQITQNISDTSVKTRVFTDSLCLSGDGNWLLAIGTVATHKESSLNDNRMGGKKCHFPLSQANLGDDETNTQSLLICALISLLAVTLPLLQQSGHNAWLVSNMSFSSHCFSGQQLSGNRHTKTGQQEHLCCAPPFIQTQNEWSQTEWWLMESF